MTVDIAARVLPHDLDAERAVLGVCLLSEEAWPTASGAITPDDFFRDAHKRIARAYARLAARGVALDLVPLLDDLRRAGDLDEVGGPAYLTALVDGLPRTAHVVHYAAVVREKARLRDIIFSANRTLADAYEAGDAASEILDRSLRRLGDIPAAVTRGPQPVDAAVQSYVDGLDRSETQAFPSGFLDVDALTGGLRPTDLTILAARPNVGKTVYALGLAETVTRAGRVCGYFSPEMTRERLAATLLAWESGVPTAAVERRTATAEQWGAFAAAFGGFAGRPLHVDDASRTVTEVAAWSRRMKRAHGLDLVIVDYLQKLLPARGGRSREEEVASISRALKELAKELDVAVVALSQLGRTPDDRRDKRPHLADLRESGALEQDADAVILLFREEMHKPTEGNAGIAEAIVAKQRQGPTGVCRLAFDKRLGRLLNLAPEGMF